MYKKIRGIATLFSAVTSFLTSCAQTDTGFGIGGDSIKVQTLDTIAANHAIDRAYLNYSPPQRFGYRTNVPDDLWEIAESPFRQHNLAGLSIVAGSSAILIWQDQHLLDGAKQLGKNIHLDPRTVFKIAFKIKDTNILKIPRNLNTVLYQMGEANSISWSTQNME